MHVSVLIAVSLDKIAIGRHCARFTNRYAQHHGRQSRNTDAAAANAIAVAMRQRQKYWTSGGHPAAIPALFEVIDMLSACPA